MKLPVLNAEGKELRRLDVDDSVFGITPNEAVLHQAFVTQRNNQRAGTAHTKTRAMVQGSTRKIRMQKYTGRARHGGIRAPIFVGGGVAFGPQTRDFGLALNKKMRRLAIRSALSGKVADGELIVIDELTFKAPRTKEVLRVLRNVGIERSALIVTGQPDRTVLASARNLEKTKVLPAAYLNVADMLNHRHVLMTEDAVKVAEGLWGRKGQEAAADGRKRRTKVEAAPAAAAEAPKRRRVKAEPEAPAVEAEKPEKAPRRTKAEAVPAAAAEAPKRRRAKAEPEAAAKAETEVAPEAAGPKPRARRAAKPVAEKPTPEAKAPRARARAAKPAAGEQAKKEKPKKAAPRATAADETPAEDAPKPRRRAKKSDGEAG